MTRTHRFLLVVLYVALPLAMVLSLGVGTYPVAPGEVLRILGKLLTHGPSSDAVTTATLVVESVRLPRVALATLAGIGLGLVGASLQGVFRNPLVGPDIVGVSSGAACGGVLAIALSLGTALTLTCAAAGGGLALLIAVALARSARAGLLGIILAGMLVSACGGAVIGIAEFLADPNSTLQSIVYWLMGSFVDADATKVRILGGAVLVFGSALLLLRWRINLLSLGEEAAAGLGVRVTVLRWVVLAFAGLIVAAQVSVSGIIGWVGLVVPHLARALVGPEHRRLLPASALVGGLFMLIVDDLARTVADQEIPVGLLTALVGAPFFAVIFRRMTRAGWQER